MNTFYVGLDLGSTFCYQCVMKPDGSIVRSRPVPTSEKQLRSAFADLDGELLVHTEAGELANWVVGIISPLVKRIVVSHPRTLAWIAKDALKNDKLDARKLADLMRSNLVHEVYLPQHNRRTFKQIVRHYDEATRAQAKCKAKLKARLRCQGIIRRDAKVFDDVERKTVLENISDKYLREMFGQFYATLDALIEDRAVAKRLMVETAKQFPEVELLQTAPGVGIIGACRFVAYIQTPARFSNKRKLWRYCRLGITRRSSDGKLLAHPRLDINGCGALKDVSRKAFDAAMRCEKDNSFKCAYEQTLANTNDKVHARLTVQRKIVATLRAMWLGKQPYHEELP